MHIDYRLYFVTDERTPIDQLLITVEEAVKGGVSIVQLREKQTDGGLFFEKAIKLKNLLKRYDVPLIINDRVDIALAAKADGIHIGQDDLPLTAVKKMIPPSMVVGVSVQTVEQAQRAEKDGADYVGVGSVFPTSTKQDAVVLPSESLKMITQSVSIPSVAIGGITLANFHQLQTKGFAGIAVVSAIMKAEQPQDVARTFLNGMTHNSNSLTPY